VVDLVDRLHDIHHFTHQLLKVTSDRMKDRYDRLTNSAGFQEGDTVWLHCQTGPEESYPSSSHPGEVCPYKVITWINNVVCQIQQYLRAKMMVVHLDRLAPYLGATQDE
jgi:hypothetical protein